MDIKTLFHAYGKAKDEMTQQVEMRGEPFGHGSFGIAVAKDKHAKKWQRFNRLAFRIEKRIEGEAVCPICVGPAGYHFEGCRYRE